MFLRGECRRMWAMQSVSGTNWCCLNSLDVHRFTFVSKELDEHPEIEDARYLFEKRLLRLRSRSWPTHVEPAGCLRDANQPEATHPALIRCGRIDRGDQSRRRASSLKMNENRDCLCKDTMMINVSRPTNRNRAAERVYGLLAQCAMPSAGCWAPSKHPLSQERITGACLVKLQGCTRVTSRPADNKW